jgi:hypothetical protein
MVTIVNNKENKVKKRLLPTLILSLIAVFLVTITGFAAASKVDVCHLEGNGSYIKINISENAFPSHVEHGDASPGEYVPDMPGWAFDETCTPYELATDTLVVDATSATVSTSDFNTKVGTQYKLVASGTYRFAAWGEAGIADAKYSLRKPPYNPYSDTDTDWVDGSDLNTPYGLQVSFYDGDMAPPLSPVNWEEDYNDAHIYTASVTGDGSPISLFIYDNVYGDNSGSITVDIYELP